MWKLVTGTILSLTLFSVKALPIKNAFDGENDSSTHLLYCPIRSERDVQALRAMEEKGSQIDIFEERIEAQGNAFIHLLTDGLTAAALMSRNGCYEHKSQSMLHKLLRPNVQPDDPATRQKRLGDAFHDDYRSYDDIMAQLASRAQVFPHLIKKKLSIGTGHEGRHLEVIHITAAELGTRPLIWIQAGQHAREWIATAATMHFIDSLLSGYSLDAFITNLLDSFEFAILPLVNPDGYEYTRVHNRMHRKNRRSPHGVDLNRNWDFMWCQIGSSRTAHSDIYCGPGAASEPEVQAVQKYVLSLQNRVIAFDVHSYGQVILRNYGWTRQNAPTEPITEPMTTEMANKMSAHEGRVYRPMKSAGLYPTSGGADDWFYVKASVPGITLEMRDRGESGFVLGREQIRPSGKELMIAIQTATKHLKNLARSVEFPNPAMVDLM